MKKFEIISRIGIIAFGLCLAAAVFAEKPASTSASPSPASKAKDGSRLSAKDRTFMMNTGRGGQMEVEWGKLAAQNGQSADVKNFGNRMITDHSKANNELMNLAKEEGVSLPAAKPPGKWKSDKDYINMMVKDHEKDLAEFQNEASNGTDPDLKRFADKYSKVVKTHLNLARGVQGKLK